MARGIARFRKWMILTHRWLGMAVGLLFVVWFVSGIAIIYGQRMPRLTPELRLERLPQLDLAAVQLSPEAAAERAGLLGSPPRALLATALDRPAYRFLDFDGRWVTVFADSGERLEGLTLEQAREVALRFLRDPAAPLRYVGLITIPDQWTVGDGMGRQLPMHKFAVDDPARTELYISERTGEVAVHTTRGSRALAWAGAIPHWLYFAPLRRNNTAWRQTILWTAGIGSLVALVGLVVGVLRFSPRGRFRIKRRPAHIPYVRWTRWHFITGAVFGVFSLTWVFSGMLSINPWWWTPERSPDYFESLAFSGGDLDLALFSRPGERPPWLDALAGRGIKEIEFTRIQGEPYLLARSAGAPAALLTVSPPGLPRELFSLDSLLERARLANPNAPVAAQRVLNRYDAYYYSRDRSLPLPVLQVKFADPEETWYYIDPAMGRLLLRYERRSRIARWLYNGLHSLDFSFWYYNRPLWDIGVIALSLGGLALSAIGVVLTYKRLARNTRIYVRSRSARRSVAAPSADRERA